MSLAEAAPACHDSPGTAAFPAFRRFHRRELRRASPRDDLAPASATRLRTA